MSFTNLSYDDGAYIKYLSQTTGPGEYALGEPQIACDSCFPYAPTVRLQRSGDSINTNMGLIDVDSELLNITRKKSKDPNMLYKPSCPNTACSSGEPCGQGVVGKCTGLKQGLRYGDDKLKNYKDCFFAREDTRLSNPSCNLRSTGWNRWEWLCQDPQERVEIPFDWNIDSKLMFKDNHRPCIPNPISSTPSLPPGGELPKQERTYPYGVYSNYTSPVSVRWQNADVISNY